MPRKPPITTMILNRVVANEVINVVSAFAVLGTSTMNAKQLISIGWCKNGYVGLVPEASS